MPAEDRQRDLLIVLNKLELQCLALPDLTPDGDDKGASPNTYDVRRAAVSMAFPELGFYHTATPSSVDQPAEMVVGDAVNDLADILRDIDDVCWVENAEGRINAVWQAKFNYEHHFGSHLADLRSYLYRLRFFGP